MNSEDDIDRERDRVWVWHQGVIDQMSPTNRTVNDFLCAETEVDHWKIETMFFLLPALDLIGG